jgi:hypothetical protein
MSLRRHSFTNALIATLVLLVLLMAAGIDQARDIGHWIGRQFKRRRA